MNNQLLNPDDINSDYQRACELLTTSCLKCRFSPDYLGAITLLKKAADLYHGSSKYEEEILCRQRLTFCFRQINSFWEEGNEYEKMAKIYINILNKEKDSLSAISNSQIAYKLGKYYDYGLKAIKTMSLIYIEKQNYKYAEKILNIGFTCIKETFHVLILKKKNDDISYIYEIVNLYIDCLCFLNEFDKAIYSLNEFILLLKNNKEEDDKNKLMSFYGSLLILLLTNNKIDEFKKKLNIAKNDSENKDDLIYNIENIYQSIENKDEKKARENLKDIVIQYSTNLSKQIVSAVNANFKNENDDENVINTLYNKKNENENIIANENEDEEELK
jgi:hypothetical protein